jgi:hypothetical protein
MMRLKIEFLHMAICRIVYNNRPRLSTAAGAKIIDLKKKIRILPFPACFQAH